MLYIWQCVHSGTPVVRGVLTRILTTKSGLTSPARQRLILRVLHLVLHYLIVQFGDQAYLQIKGTAIGTPAAVVFAVVFLYVLEIDLVSEFVKAGRLLLFKRYIDDILAFFVNKQAALDFIARYERLDPDINITATVAREVNFLDLTIYSGPRIADGRLDIRLYVKPSNQFLYIPDSSFHTRSARTAWIVSELRRFVLNNTERSNYQANKEQFYNNLLLRGFKAKTLQPFFERVQYFQRSSFLTSVKKSVASGPKQRKHLMIVQHDPLTANLHLEDLLRVHWPALLSSVPGVFGQPMVAYSNPENLLTLNRRLHKISQDVQVDLF